MRVATTEHGQRIVNRPRNLSRSDRHVDRGREMIISGDDDVLLECPFRQVTSTYCVHCGDDVPLSTVAWSDTGEPFLRQVSLYFLGNAYEGAVALQHDSRGRRKS